MLFNIATCIMKTEIPHLVINTATPLIIINMSHAPYKHIPRPLTSLIPIFFICASFSSNSFVSILGFLGAECEYSNGSQ